MRGPEPLDALGEAGRLESLPGAAAAGSSRLPPRKCDDHGRSRAVTHSRRGRRAFPGRPEDRDPVGGRGIDRIDPDTRRAPPVPGIRGPAATRHPNDRCGPVHRLTNATTANTRAGSTPRVARAARDRSTHTTRTSQSLPVAPSAHRRGATSFSRSFTQQRGQSVFQVGDRGGQRVQWSVSAVCTTRWLATARSRAVPVLMMAGRKTGSVITPPRDGHASDRPGT